MVTIDANLPIYAYNTASVFYPKASRWLEEKLNSGVEIGIPMQSILAFIRISTNPRLSDKLVTVSDALAVVDGWLARPQVRILSSGPSHWAIFRRLYLESNASGKLSTDIHIAALTIEHDATLYTTDADFARFPGLRWQNPLVP